MSTANVVFKIVEVVKEFGFTLKEKRKEVISVFGSGNDVSVVFQRDMGSDYTIPKVHDRIHNFKGLHTNCIMCITTSCVLMMDQKKVIEIGISGELIFETHFDIERV